MFTESKYTKWYFSIVNRAISRGLDKSKLPYYTECHHIHPRSCGGNDTNDNLVLLNAKEHFVVHHILTKIMSRYDHEQKMIYAFGLMSKQPEFKLFVTSRLYVDFKINNPRLGTKHSIQTKLKISNSKKGKKRSIETRNKISNSFIGLRAGDKHPMAKLYKITNVNTKEEYITKSLTKWTKNNPNIGNLKNTLRSKTPTRKGFIATYL